MQKITIEMPSVEKCEATVCAYNTQCKCHAKAITVGDGDIPGCDTFLRAEGHAQSSLVAGVGACKVTGCRHNEDFECTADSINVGYSGGEVLCRTYSPR